MDGVAGLRGNPKTLRLSTGVRSEFSSWRAMAPHLTPAPLGCHLPFCLLLCLPPSDLPDVPADLFLGKQ
jgi:hypothetical protein